jgi:hypothetical protein
MYQLDILTKIPEPKHDGIIRIRPGESAIVRADGGDTAPDIRGRPVEWKNKTIPSLVITITDDLPEIFRAFQAAHDPEDAVPFLAISSDRDALLSCRAEGKILFRQTADCSGRAPEPMRYLQETIAKTEYCIILCSRKNPGWLELAGEIVQSAREQNTLTVLAMIGAGEQDFYDNVSEIVGKFHTIILTPDNSSAISMVSLEQIRDLCEATTDEIVGYGGRPSLEPDDPGKVRELLFNGGISYLGCHVAGEPDAQSLIRGYVKSVQGNQKILNGGTYSILKIPWESTINAAVALRNSFIDILVEKVPSRYPHYMRIEGYYPEIEGHIDVAIWTFTGNSE